MNERDLVYLNSIYETLDEEVGIKRTKLKPFYDFCTRYDSQRNAFSNHQELIKPRRRRVRYDYGNANYDEISGEEAIKLVKEDKSNIQKLRIIYDLSDKGSLVEYEVRDNGSIYPIYGSTESVEIDGKIYRNIRFAPWKKVLETADLIYITDEYDRFLDDDDSEEAQSRRTARDGYVELPLYVDKSNPPQDYNPHELYANAYRRGVTNIYKYPQRYAPLSVDTGAHKLSDQYPPKIAETLRDYIDSKQSVREIYKALDRYRRALRKLESEKDILSEDEYLRKKQKWQSEYNLRLSRYRNAIESMKKFEAKVEKEIDSGMVELIENLRRNIYDYDKAIKKGLDATAKLQKLKEKIIGDILDHDLYGDLFYTIDSLRRSAEKLIQGKKQLEGLVADIEADQEEHSRVQTQIEDYAELFDRYLEAANQLKADKLNNQIEEINKLVADLKNVDAELAKLRPKAAAEKAARKQKAGSAELDSALVDIIDFTDSSEDTN